MKKLQLTPPLLIITMGYPGAGKTYFSRQFSELYNIPRLSEEVYRFELFEQPLFNKDESQIIERILHYSLLQLMKSEQTIICDGDFLTLKQRKAMYELAAGNGYRTLTIWLQTDADTSATRAGTRDKRSLDNKFSFAIDRSTFSRIADRLERPVEKEQTVVISGKHAFRSQCLTVLRKITSMYSESLVNGETGVVNPLADPRRPVVKPKLSSRRYIQ